MQYENKMIRVYFALSSALKYSEHVKYLRGVRSVYTVSGEISDRRCTLEELDVDGRH